MPRGFFLVLSLVLGAAPVALAQAGSERDLRIDERQLQRYEWQLQQDKSRLQYDRRRHASRWQIREDEVQTRRDREAIRSLRADMRHDHRIRRRYRTS